MSRTCQGKKERSRGNGKNEKKHELRMGKRLRGLFVCWLLALRLSNRLVYLRDGSA